MFKKIVSIIIAVILCISVGLCCITVVKSALGLDKSLFGLRVFYLVSGSMEPTIPTGAAVLVHKNAEYEVNDVITFESSDSYIYGLPNTHRIVGCTEINGQKAYITKGDANPVADTMAVKESAIYGKVICHTGKIRWLGTLIGMLTTPLGFIAVIVLPILLIVAILMRDFKKEYKAALAAEVESAAGAAPANGQSENETTDTELKKPSDPSE